MGRNPADVRFFLRRSAKSGPDIGVGNDHATCARTILAHALAEFIKQPSVDERWVARYTTTNLPHVFDKVAEGDQRNCASGSFPGLLMLVNAGPVPLQYMVSTCQSAHIALIFLRLLCVPPVALPPGALVWAKTFTPGGAEVPSPRKLTVAVDACAGANTIKLTGLVILSADIGTFPGKTFALIP